jgi:catalase-peroxidase
MTIATTSKGNEKCPFLHAGNGTKNHDWWPEQINVKILAQNNERTNPMPKDFNYGEEFCKLDLAALKEDLTRLMTDSQDWWPADYGHYGPFFVRMAWHSAGTYRVSDGRGGAGAGQQRFAPLNSWPDNGNLDKARRLLWPIKQKYGRRISWADLLCLAGNVALESMGFPTFGYAGGREDVWEPEDDVNWGQETTWLNGDKRYQRGGGVVTKKGVGGGEEKLDDPLAAVLMGLIYVNPEGQDGNADPLDSARYIRDTFARMSMNDEETVALVAGGHTFGKCHGAGDPTNVGPEPEGAPLEEQGLGWRNRFRTGRGADTITSGLEGAWNGTPTRWDNAYFDTLFGYEWELTTSPAGAKQWRPKGGRGSGTVPDAHDPTKFHAPMMLTTDLALRVDPKYAAISRRFHKNPEQFQRAFARAWYKLTHRDMGPYIRCLGPEAPEPQIWQDPLPAVKFPFIDSADQAELKAMILATGLSSTRLVATAWAAASTYRNSDKRGGANGGRIRLDPQRNWKVNEPDELRRVLRALEGVQTEFNSRPSNSKQVSIADLIVLGGNTGVEAAAKAAGHDVVVPFTSGRTDASQLQTDVEQQGHLEPVADGFRNYVRPGVEARPEELLVDKAFLLALTAPEMTVLVGGLRVLGVGTKNSSPFTDHVGRLSNDFFVNLLDMGTAWSPVSSPSGTIRDHLYEGRDRTTGRIRWIGTSVDLLFGSHSVLRALAEVYASDDCREQFVRDFCAAFAKVMDLDRFDVNHRLNRSRI